jgi:hypothetical protein
MDRAKRSELLRRRIMTLGRYATLVPQAAPARGQVKAKKPTEPPKRVGVTWPVTGAHPVRVSLGVALVARRGKRLETQRPTKNYFKRLELSREKRVCPLVRIADAWPTKLPRSPTVSASCRPD